MKSGNFIFKGLSAAAIALALCVIPGEAAIQRLTLGSGTKAELPLGFLSATPGVANDANNPNLFPVYFAESAIGNFGFLLDESEWSKTLMKRFEEAHATAGDVTIYYDDNPAAGFKIPHTFWGPNIPVPVCKIVYVSTGSNKVP